ncbi:MAG: hypothetical protein ABIE43_00710 [Patescibacteria group bacterium]
MAKIFKFIKRIRVFWRILRYFEYIARIDHWSCERCNLPIFAGDYYHGWVEVCKRFLRVRKFHQACPIDPDYDEEFRRGEGDGNIGSVKWPLAA